MADLTIIPRGAFTQASSTAPTTAVAVDESVQLGDYLLAVASDDYVPFAGNPGAPSCPIVAAWSELAAAADPPSGSSVEVIRAWLGKVTTAPTEPRDGAAGITSRTVTVSQTGSSGLHLITRPLYGGSADAVIALDGLMAAIADRTTPYTHPTITPTGTLDLLVTAFGAVQFTGTPIAYGLPPWAQESTAIYHNEFSGLQVALQQLAAATATGTRDQTSNIAGTLAGGAGVRFLLRSQGTAPVAGDDRSGRFAFAQ